MSAFREIIITVLVAIVITFLLHFGIEARSVHYSCMLPNLEEGEYIMVDKVIYHFSDPERGEVIVFWPPEELGSANPFIKRIIGLPGDTIEVKNGKVFIDDIPLEEEYLKEPFHYTVSSRRIPYGEYFVLGDNRNNADDSHVWGTLPRQNIIGRAWFIYWPLNRCRMVKHYSYPELEGAEG